MKRIKKPTGPQILHAIANGVIDVHIGNMTAEVFSERVYNVLVKRGPVRKNTQAKGDYSLT